MAQFPAEIDKSSLQEEFIQIQTGKRMSYEDAYSLSTQSAVLFLNEKCVEETNALKYHKQATPLHPYILHEEIPFGNSNSLTGGINSGSGPEGNYRRESVSEGNPRSEFMKEYIIYPLHVGSWRITGEYATRQPIVLTRKRTHLPIPFHKTNAVAIRNTKGQYLWVYNGKTWGFPKGLPSYVDFEEFLAKVCVSPPSSSPIHVSCIPCSVPESPKDAAIREVREEVGITLTDELWDLSRGTCKFGNVFTYDTKLTPMEHFYTLLYTPIDIEIKAIAWSNVPPSDALNPISRWTCCKLKIL